MNQAIDLERLIQLRHHLHQHAELSNQEEETAKIIKAYISQFSPDTVYDNIGGHGLVFEFLGGDSKGKKIAFRADIDALPIDENIDLAYGSKTQGIAHKCGHDGHTTMVAAIAEIIASNRPLNNSIYLIFQPAEETGTGAEAMVDFFKEESIQLDNIFGLHNLPGFEKGQIISRAGTFAAASTGMIITLKGNTSHAAEPENGLSPALAFSSIIKELYHLAEKIETNDLVLCTVIQANMGEIAFGTSPGYAEIRATLRANKDADLKLLMKSAEQMVAKHATNSKLKYSFSYTESFPSTENSEAALALIQEVTTAQSLPFHLKADPFKWSEDFGHFKKLSKSAFFGLGAGKDCPMLHNETYDFPDEIIADGVKMYSGIIQLLEKKHA